MKKIEFPIGTKVRGYGVLNEYGEFDFIPEQTGARQGQVKLIKRGDDYSVSNSKHNVIVHLSFAKGEKLVMIKRFLRIVNDVTNILREYEI